MSNIVAGRQPVLEAIKSGNAIEKIVLQYGTRGGVIDRIRSDARQHSIPVVELDRRRFQELAGDSNTQGVCAVISSTSYVEIADLLETAKQSGEPPLLLLLDGIEDPQNLGALMRTAECAGVHGVVLPKHHSAGVTETVTKTSAGASMHLPAARVTNLVQAMEELKEAGVWIIGTDSTADRPFTDVDYKGPVALVVGNEGKGMRRLVREQCDFLVQIPLHGRIESLNASVAGALVMFEAARQRHPGNLKPSS